MVHSNINIVTIIDVHINVETIILEVNLLFNTVVER